MFVADPTLRRTHSRFFRCSPGACSGLGDVLHVRITVSNGWPFTSDLRGEGTIAPRSLGNAVDGALNFGFAYADERIALTNTNAFYVIFVETDVVDEQLL